MFASFILNWHAQQFFNNHDCPFPRICQLPNTQRTLKRNTPIFKKSHANPTHSKATYWKLNFIWKQIWCILNLLASKVLLFQHLNTWKVHALFEEILDNPHQKQSIYCFCERRIKMQKIRLFVIILIDASCFTKVEVDFFQHDHKDSRKFFKDRHPD